MPGEVPAKAPGVKAVEAGMTGCAGTAAASGGGGGWPCHPGGGPEAIYVPPSQLPTLLALAFVDYSTSIRPQRLADDIQIYRSKTKQPTLQKQARN